MTNKKRIFSIGDLHGNYPALAQLLERSGFRFAIDEVRFMGDVVDGWGEDLECIRLLNKLNGVMMMGNHDFKVIEHLTKGRAGRIHERTYESLSKECGHGLEYYQDLPLDVQLYFEKLKKYHRETINGVNMLFVHAGFNRHFKFDEQPNNGNETFLWDRDLYLSALAYDKFDSPYPFRIREKNIDRIFIGHTPTIYLDGRIEPVRLLNDSIINVDTGGGFGNGRVTMINVEDLDEVYYSDLSKDLYPNLKSIKGKDGQ